mmetsp:Transcript_82727/g.146518  ORF Transcript_82727/g.146518 Transcript_82727/m.146518 type:complete len:87 (-) Transcript_82727:48-308(-)
MFSTVDSWLERLSGGQIRRPRNGEEECMQCRAVGTAVFYGATLHAGLEAWRASPRTANRCFFGAVAMCFFAVGTWRAVTPSAKVHG